MAKGKKGPALFEVIRAAQQKQVEQQQKLAQQRAAGPGVLTTAAAKLRDLRWLRGKESNSPAEHLQAPVMREVSPNPISAHLPPVGHLAEDQHNQDLSAAHQSPDAPLEQSSPERETFETSTVQHVAPVVSELPPKTYEQSASPQVVHRVVVVPAADTAPTPAEEIARRVREEIAAASRMKETYDDISPDPVLNSVADLFGPQQTDDSSEKTSRSFKLPFQFSYTTGLAAGVALLLIVSLIVIFARIGNRGTTPVSVADSAVRPDVMDIKPSTGTNQTRTAQGGTTPNRTNGVTGDSGNQTAMGRATPPKVEGVGVESSYAPVLLPANGKRIIGVQYVVLLSFPRQEPADELVKFLASKGVQVTAEKGLPGYSQTWYSVVTTTGFQRTRPNPQYDAFIEPIISVMKEFAKGSKFKSFKPDVYTWRAPS